MPRPTLRATAAFALVGLWMALLFAGHPLQGLTHLLLLTALILFPWGSARSPDRPLATPPPPASPPGKEVRSVGAPPRQP